MKGYLIRALYNTLIIPYFINNRGVFYWIGCRDHQIWHVVAVGEAEELPKHAALRELSEELGLDLPTIKLTFLHSLDKVGSVSIGHFSDFKDTWQEGLFVIPIYCFAYEMPNKEVRLFDEHNDFQWLNYDEAVNLLHFDLDKTVLWELSKRIETKNLSSN